ncbi:HIT family protein [Candidatus Pacearchaeota archaeon]|nr:HIT family protein [Candidatus Pacearchaeota archaeon]
MESCIFCKIARGEISSEKIYENENFFSIKDIHPKVKGHSLVISKKHLDTFLELPDTFSSGFLDALKNTARKLLKEEKAAGFNIVNNNGKVAGQLVNHLHFHILPRKEKDAFGLGV